MPMLKIKRLASQSVLVTAMMCPMAPSALAEGFIKINQQALKQREAMVVVRRGEPVGSIETASLTNNGFKSLNRQVTQLGGGRQSLQLSVRDEDQSNDSRDSTKPVNSKSNVVITRMSSPHPAAVKPAEEVVANPDAAELFGDAVYDSGSGAYGWPVILEAQQRVSSGYGTRSDPFHGNSAFHHGIDIAAKLGTDVIASETGEVVGVGNYGGYGLTVRIDHGGGLETQYGHLSRISVKQGDRVLRGQFIGKIGSTGRSTGPHLDFSVRKNGESVNPVPYLMPRSEIKTAQR